MAGVLSALSDELTSLSSSAAPAVVGLEHRRGHGTGFVLAHDGYILTNCHVVRSSGRLRVRLGESEQTRGDVVGVDERTDLAVIRAEARGLRSLPMADIRQVRVGQLVVAIGYPLRFERSVSLGVVSALDRSLPVPDNGLLEGLIQTDAAINPGNSGGPLLDVEGRVVGIATAIVPFAQGIGFAIPASTATWVASVLIQKGEVSRPLLGIAAKSEELDASVAQQAGQARGVRVFRVGRDTPADVAGMREDDLVLAANGESVASIDDLQRVMVLSGAPQVQLRVLRGGKRHELLARPRPDSRAA